MAKEDGKKQSNLVKNTPSKPKGRSFCCSVFIYTFVFVSGVIVATILPDLVGHHFKQPYGKEYAALAERVFQNLPKHLNTFSETVVSLGQTLVDRLWDFKTLAEERLANIQGAKN